MTRFQKEINGQLGDYWKQNADKELEKIKREIDDGSIYVDSQGILRNCIGRIACEEYCEKCAYLGIKFDATETELTRKRQTTAELAEYREEMKNHKPSGEELYEMQTAFGKETKIKDVITRKEIEY